MNDPKTTRPLICPFCETRELKPLGVGSARCPSCQSFVGGRLLETLQWVRDLPEALGRHACECGHPEMRRLPDGVFHCPACGSEVLPIEPAPHNRRGYSEAYLAGWLDGRYSNSQPFTENLSLARWQSVADRLDYYRGHRAGRMARTFPDDRPLQAA
ncbi:MAG: hypothetical protein AB1425_08965 [Actinomycetota bacterium]